MRIAGSPVPPGPLGPTATPRSGPADVGDHPLDLGPSAPLIRAGLDASARGLTAEQHAARVLQHLLADPTARS